MDFNRELNDLIDSILKKSKEAGSPLKRKDIAATIGLKPGTLTKIAGGHQNANANHVALIKDKFGDLLQERKYTDSSLDNELLGIHSTMDVLLRAVSKLQALHEDYSPEAQENLRRLKQEIALVSVERQK